MHNHVFGISYLSGMGSLRWLVVIGTLIVPAVCNADYSPGIPNPPIDPQIPSPTPPAEWSAGAVDNHFYVDNTSPNATDIDNPLGYPARPRLTIPTGLFAAGSYIEIHGGPYEQSTRIDIRADGTQQSPVWIHGDESQLVTLQTPLAIDGSYVIVENLRFDQSRKTLGIASGSSYILLRNNTLSGPEINDGNTAAIAISGSATAPTQNIVLYGNSISGFGDRNPNATENDYHGIKGTRYCTDIWILNNHIFNMSGDSVQIGDASLPDSERCSRIYIADNSFHANRENAVDIKNSMDIIIANNRMFDFFASGSSAGTALVVHNGADDIWIFGNTISDSAVGVANTGGTNIWVIANLFLSMTSFAIPLDVDSYYGAGVAVHYRGVSSGGIVNNTFFGNEKGIQIAGGQPYEISGNIFTNRSVGNSYDIMIRTTSLAGSTNIFDNLHSDFAIRVSSTAYLEPADFIFAYPANHGLLQGQPQFSDPNNGDFRLVNNSPGTEVGSESDAYTQFRTQYGLSIGYDHAQVQRPATGAWDLGALQSPSGPIPESPSELN